VKASLRAKDPTFRVDLAAARFNGGGHACAAGLNLKQNAEGCYDRLVAVLAERLALADAAQGAGS
jgi:phosphoesterase RecJ-like protein